MDELKEFLQEVVFKDFSLKNFFKKKFLLIAALVCEIISLLIDKGIISLPAEYEGRFLVAGVVLMFIWLVMDGLQRKYKKMAAAFESQMADAEESADEESTAPEN